MGKMLTRMDRESGILDVRLAQGETHRKAAHAVGTTVAALGCRLRAARKVYQLFNRYKEQELFGLTITVDKIWHLKNDEIQSLKSELRVVSEEEEEDHGAKDNEEEDNVEEEE